MTNEDIQLRIDHVKAEIKHIERMVAEREKQQALPPVGSFIEVQWRGNAPWDYVRVVGGGLVQSTIDYPSELSNVHAWRYHLADWSRARNLYDSYLHLSDGTARFARGKWKVGEEFATGVLIVHVETRPEGV